LQDSPGYNNPADEYEGEADSELQGDFWGEFDQEVHQQDDEKLYGEDPSFWSSPPPSRNATAMEGQQQQQQQQWLRQQAPQGIPSPYRSSNSDPSSPSSSSSAPPVWLSLCYPKLASALAAVAFEDAELMQLLGDAAVRVLPLLTSFELADLAIAYAQLGMPHQQLLPALAVQLTQHACNSSSSSSGVQGSAGESEVAAVIQCAHALGQLGFADGQLVEAVQAKVLSSRSMGGTGQLAGRFAGQLAGNVDVAAGLGSSSAAAVGPQQLVQLLELLVSSGSSSSSNGGSNGGRNSSSSGGSRSKTAPLVRWVCNAVTASGLEALQPLQLQAAAAALVELQPYPEAAAAAAVVGAASVARAEECGAEVLAEVLWCCVTLRCSNAVLAETAVSAVERAAVKLQQQQQQGQRKGKKKRTAKQTAAGTAAGMAMQHAAAAAAVVLGSKHQAQLAWSLQQIGRPDLVQRVVAAVHTAPVI
jgi:hypothetical protein